ncbi:nuclear pore complex protein Nup50-like [Meriones unguiculatus]|uniref:nuclear pore complex protein Nup50-like n=1 Tax=Meriones unguiculatus TaxID=10047 RepID=UPI00108DAA56|nr:nuclear pore complex protein Nup50-like [Meriones unguiculatus]
MAKKIAKKEVTGRNWHQDAEEEGTFSLASEDVLRNRTIKRAKRRHARLQSNGRGTSKGMKSLPVPSGREEIGGGPEKKPLEGLTTRKNTAQAAAEPKGDFGSVTANEPTSMDPEQISDPQPNGHSQPPVSPSLAFSQACAGSIYHRQLTGLNCSVRDWIVKHVNANPFCDLTPVFKQYEKYLTAIEKQLHSSCGCLSESELSRDPAGTQPPSLAVATDQQPEPGPPEKAELTSERRADPPQRATSASSNSGKITESQAWAPLSSGPVDGVSSSTRRSSSNGKGIAQKKPVSARALESPALGSSEESESRRNESPKAAPVEEKEECPFYSKRCKLFYKKDNDFKERGAGTLSLKATANQKTRLLVQDPRLGNTLLNVLVPPSMPCSRMGKNNVLIVCVPNPPLEKNAAVEATMLIRVKSSKDADELHRILLQKMDA